MATLASGNSSEENADEDGNYVKMTLPVLIPTAIGLVILIILAITGNLMTIIAYLKDQRSPSIYDFYIFHLAVTDLLISSISMPFYSVYTLMEFMWPFGYTFCKVWLAADFTFCFESILLMLLLSLDRMLLLKFGTRYSLRMTMKLAKSQIIISWILSFIVYGPAIIGWNHWVGYSSVETNDCDVEFVFNFHFTAVTSVIEFVLPFIILSGMNIFIFIQIRKRTSVTAGVVALPSTSRVTESVNTTCNKFSVKLDNPRQISRKIDTNTFSNSDCNKGFKRSLNLARCKGSSQSNTEQESQSRVRRDFKAARFLAILVVIFLILWAPYTVTTMVIAFCGDKCLNISLYEFFNWVLWFKSAINPLSYAMNSSFYRRHFLRYLRNITRLITCNRKKQSAVQTD